MKFLLAITLVAIFGVGCNRAHDMEREEDTQTIQREEEYDAGDVVDETPSNMPTTEEQAVGTEQ